MSKLLTLVCLAILALNKNSHALEEDLTPFIKMTMEEMLRHYKYSVTDFNLTTTDGYILKMFRLQNTTAFNKNLFPVMFFHGLTGCSNTWFLLGKQSLALLLADLGYDIWLPNARGTLYSRKHVFLNPKSSDFWKFTWHEIAVYDMPASIDVTLKETGHKKVSVISHSEGTSYFMAMVADLPEYDNKVEVGILMGPGIFFRNLRMKFLKPIASFHRIFEWLSDTLKLNSVVPEYYAEALPILCHPSFIFSPICKLFIETLFEDAEQLQPDTYTFIMSKVPCGGNINELLHFVQNVDSGGFNHYDYNPKKNMRLYNSTTPPPYPLENIKCKIIILHGKHDFVASKNDVNLLVSKLSNVVHVESPNNSNWSHMDYLVAKDVYSESYSRIIKFLRIINRGSPMKKRRTSKSIAT